MSAAAKRGGLMTPKYEALVRLVRELGTTNIEQLLTEYRAQAVDVPTMRHILGVLEERGWLLKVSQPRAGRPTGVAWTVSEEALPHLWQDARLPLRPDPLPRRTRAGADHLVDATQKVRPAPGSTPQSAHRPTPTPRPAAAPIAGSLAMRDTT